MELRGGGGLELRKSDGTYKTSCVGYYVLSSKMGSWYLPDFKYSFILWRTAPRLNTYCQKRIPKTYCNDMIPNYACRLLIGHKRVKDQGM